MDAFSKIQNSRQLSKLRSRESVFAEVIQIENREQHQQAPPYETGEQDSHVELNSAFPPDELGGRLQQRVRVIGGISEGNTARSIAWLLT